MLEAELAFEHDKMKAVIKGRRNEHSGRSMEIFEFLYEGVVMAAMPIEELRYVSVETVYIFRKIVRRGYASINSVWRSGVGNEYALFMEELGKCLEHSFQRDFRIYHESLSLPHELCKHLTLLAGKGGVRVYLYDPAESSDTFALTFTHQDHGYAISGNICVRHDAHIKRKEVFHHENGRVTDPEVLLKESQAWVNEFAKKWNSDRQRIANMKSGINNRWPHIKTTIAHILDRINQGKHI